MIFPRTRAALRRLTGVALFWVGDGWSRVAVERGLGHHFQWPHRFYSWCMETSDRLNPWMGPD